MYFLMKCAKLELNIINLLAGTAISRNVCLDVLIYLVFIIEYYSASVQRLSVVTGTSFHRNAYWNPEITDDNKLKLCCSFSVHNSSLLINFHSLYEIRNMNPSEGLKELQYLTSHWYTLHHMVRDFNTVSLVNNQ